jgi:hypothetical protein
VDGHRLLEFDEALALGPGVRFEPIEALRHLLDLRIDAVYLAFQAEYMGQERVVVTHLPALSYPQGIALLRRGRDTLEPMMQGLTDLLGQMKGTLALLAIVSATVLTAMRIMTVDAWKDFALTLTLGYMGANTVQRVGEAWAGRKNGRPALVPPPLPPGDG